MATITRSTPLRFKILFKIARLFGYECEVANLSDGSRYITCWKKT